MAEIDGDSSLLESPNENTDELIHVSKPIVKILCYGSNDFKCSELQFELSEERGREHLSGISLHYAQDLNLFDKFAVPVYTQEITQLIGEGVDVFLILIGLNNKFSQSMFDLLTSIPNILKFEEEDKRHFWKRAVIAFDANDHPNPEDLINKSMEGNIGIKRMVEMVGGRYTYLSTVKPDALVDGLVKQCRFLTTKHGGKEIVRGKGQQSTIVQYRGGSVLTLIWRKGNCEMSVSSMNLILRTTRLSKEELERFRENYRDPKAKVSFEEVLKFLAHGDGEASEEMKRLREEYEDPTAKY